MVQLYARSGAETLVNASTPGLQSNARITRLSSGGFVVAWTDSSGIGGDSSGSAVKAQIYSAAGAKVGGEFLVNTATSGSQIVESVAATASGGFAAVYLTENQAIRAQIFDSSGSKTGGEILVTVVVPNPGVMNQNASVAVLTNGVMIVTWARWDPYAGPNNGEHVFARAFNAATGAPLGNEFRLDTGTDPALYPSVTALASGGWVATWSFPGADGTHDVKGQIFAANGVKVGGEFLVNTATANVNQGPSSVVALAGGGFVVAWFDHDTIPGESGYWGIRAQIFSDAGAKIGSDFLVNTITEGDQGSFSLDDLPGGGFVVSWTDASRSGGDPQGTGIMAQVFDSAGGKVGTQFLVNTITGSDQYSPAVAALASGGFATVWQSRVGNDLDTDIKLQLFAPSSGAATDIALSPASVSETSLGNYAVATLSDYGGVNGARTYTLLADSTGGGFRIEGNRLVVADNRRFDHETAPTANLTVRVTDANGASFDEVLSVAIADSTIEQRYTAQPEFTAADDIYGGVSGVAAAGIFGGTFVVTWADDEADGGTDAGSIKAQLYDATGTATGPVFAVNSTTPGYQGSPSATGTALGDFVIVWEDGSLLGGDSSFSGIKGQRFDSLGVKKGGEFQVNTITEGFQVEASVAALSNGGFVVTWSDRSDYTGDIKAQLYNWEGARVGGELLVNTTSAHGQGHVDSTVAGFPAGGFVVSWTNSQTGDVHAQIFDQAANKVGGEIQVATLTGRWGDAQPTVAVLASGHFVVAWTNSNGEVEGGSFTSIQAQIFDSAGTRVGGQFLVNTTIDYFQTHATVSALPWGGFVVSWQDGSQTGDDFLTNAVRAQVFDSTGAKVGVEFLVNKGVDNDQGVPFSTVLSSGGFVLGWKETYHDDVGTKARYEGRVFSLTQADNSGNDTIIGDPDANLLDGGAGNDQIYGNGGNDDLRGGTGNDWLHVSGTGIVAADGGGDFDYLEVNWGDATTAITMGYPNADPNGGLTGTIGDGGARRVDYASINIFVLATGSGNDVLYGGQSGSSASLGSGDDRFYGSGGYETVDGGPGVDGVSAGLGLATSPVVWNLQTNTYSSPIGSYTNFEYFLGIFTGSANDVIVTTAANLNDIVNGAAGDDTITVINGQDHAAGDFGNDLLIIDYSGSASAIVTTGGAAGITLGANSSGISGQIGDGGSRRVNFFDVDRFDVRTGSGNDAIVLGTGSLVTNDLVSLGGGDDSVDFGAGTDVGDGGSGVDSLAADLSSASVSVMINLATNSYAGPAGTSFVNFEYFGGSGFQTGQGGDSVVTGLFNRNDRVALGAGNDTVILYDGQDTVFGGAAGAGATDSGFDTLVLNYGAATAAVHNVGAIQTNAAGAFGQIGDDSTRLATFQAIDRFLIVTGSGNDSIATAGGNDEIRTGAGADSISAGAGNDLLDGGAGADTMTGGGGSDAYVVDDAGDVVIENASEGRDEIRTALASFSLVGLPNVENLTATSDVAHDFRGNAGNNRIEGGAGNDLLRLYDGGDDVVLGGAGSDNIFFIGTLTASDFVRGGSGTDTLILQGAYGALTLTANIVEIENISLLAGSNTNFGEPGTNRYDYVLITHNANFAAGLQVRVNGAALLEGEDFTFDGSAETDAKFVVYGGKGVDTLTGGLGHDIFFYAEERFASGDTVNGGAGYDGMFLRGNYTIDFNTPGYTGLFTNIENLTLTSATDERYARGGGSEFDYNLTLSNAIVKPGETLTVSGALLMATETMILDASQEADGLLRLFGGRAGDILKGGANADLLHGNLGVDILTGNGGADVFRYDATAESSSGSMDQITDFTPGTDKIDLSRIDASTLAAGDQGFSWIGSNAFTGSAGQLRAYQQGGTWFVEGDTNGDGVADLMIALTLQGATPLGAGDFIL